jgi:glycine/serine hydroxymethyltransferase
MTEAVTKIEQAVEEAASQYFRLVILAGAPASGKTAGCAAKYSRIGRGFDLAKWEVRQGRQCSGPMSVTVKLRV